MAYIVRNITGNSKNRSKNVILDIPVGKGTQLVELLPGHQLIIESNYLPQSVKKAQMEGTIVTEFITNTRVNIIKSENHVEPIVISPVIEEVVDNIIEDNVIIESDINLEVIETVKKNKPSKKKSGLYSPEIIEEEKE
jgi:hypothetical protein